MVQEVAARKVWKYMATGVYRQTDSFLHRIPPNLSGHEAGIHGGII